MKVISPRQILPEMYAYDSQTYWIPRGAHDKQWCLKTSSHLQLKLSYSKQQYSQSCTPHTTTLIYPQQNQASARHPPPTHHHASVLHRCHLATCSHAATTTSPPQASHLDSHYTSTRHTAHQYQLQPRTALGNRSSLSPTSAQPAHRHSSNRQCTHACGPRQVRSPGLSYLGPLAHTPRRSTPLGTYRPTKTVSSTLGPS